MNGIMQYVEIRDFHFLPKNLFFTWNKVSKYGLKE